MPSKKHICYGQTLMLLILSFTTQQYNLDSITEKIKATTMSYITVQTTIVTKYYIFTTIDHSIYKPLAPLRPIMWRWYFGSILSSTKAIRDIYAQNSNIKPCPHCYYWYYYNYKCIDTSDVYSVIMMSA